MCATKERALACTQMRTHAANSGFIVVFDGPEGQWHAKTKDSCDVWQQPLSRYGKPNLRSPVPVGFCVQHRQAAMGTDEADTQSVASIAVSHITQG